MDIIKNNKRIIIKKHIRDDLELFMCDDGNLLVTINIGGSEELIDLSPRELSELKEWIIENT